MSMFGDNPFKHSSVKKLIVAFGQLFSDITIMRLDVAGETDQVIRVPISYGPRNKWLSRMNEDPDLKRTVEIVLPRIGFEITGYRYDPTRKVGPQGNYLNATVGPSHAKVYNPVPYDVTIVLSSMCKTQEESLQILEQIVPYFAPALTVTLEILPQFGITKDIPIVLNNISVQDTYEGSPEEYRTVIQTFTFTAKIDLFGPIIGGKVIKRSIADVGFNRVPTTEDFDLQYQAEVVPFEAIETDPHTVTEEWFGFK